MELLHVNSASKGQLMQPTTLQLASDKPSFDTQTFVNIKSLHRPNNSVIPQKRNADLNPKLNQPMHLAESRNSRLDPVQKPMPHYKLDKPKSFERAP